MTFTVNENTTSGTVGRVTANDPDGDAITYSVGGTDETTFKEDFSLDASNGLITVRSDATIDHETKPSYSVTITATDPYGGTDTVALTINITDVDETGMVTLSQTTPTVGEPLTATLSDPDGTATGATWTWSWNTTSTGSFHHHQRGQQRELYPGHCRRRTIPEGRRKLHRPLRLRPECRAGVRQRGGSQPTAPSSPTQQ